MAINKKQSSLWVKVVLVFVVVAFVASLVPALFMGGGNTQQATGATETGATLERIANDHLPAVNSYTAMLASEPTSYTALVGLGNTYFDWGVQIQQGLGPNTGHDLPYWASATTAYERALAQQPGDPNVSVDMAIAYFYSGQTSRAIEVAEQVMADVPEFAPAYFNAGIFYRAAGRMDDAAVAFTRYLEIEPDGQSASAAQSMLAELPATPSGEATTTP
ncbi:MAG: tetratricopeptide repeat protein [Anaerosomatales bacterium]|nr:tetratricopeptide repeat protein [Anaerosomatales bacterium]MDT8434819.1 tetratricopeptide repeat protein [Anaerosomatales bacterium]